MEPTRKEPEMDRPRYSFGVTLALVTGMVVLVVGLSVVIALVGGFWLDRQLDTKPVFMILFVVASGPISLYVIYRMTIAATSRMNPVLPARQGQSNKTFDQGGEDE
jgi:F0F1-type ATP synthase assembly protein I